jgi:hypothetical protein
MMAIFRDHTLHVCIQSDPLCRHSTTMAGPMSEGGAPKTGSAGDDISIGDETVTMSNVSFRLWNASSKDKAKPNIPSQIIPPVRCV